MLLSRGRCGGQITRNGQRRCHGSRLRTHHGQGTAATTHHGRRWLTRGHTQQITAWWKRQGRRCHCFGRINACGMTSFVGGEIE